MPLSKPTLIAIGGFAGAGKNTLARNLGAYFSIPVFEVDQVAKSIRSSPSFVGSSQQAYQISFDFIFDFAKQHLEIGGSMVFDQNLGHQLTWETLNRLRDDLGEQAEVKIFILELPYELCLERFSNRTEHPNLNEVTLDDLESHKFKWDYLNENELPNATRIDATEPPEDVLKNLVRLLK